MPAKLGGIAGGTKFTVEGILFKFALDSFIEKRGQGTWLYGYKTDEANDEKGIYSYFLKLTSPAMKSSCNELKVRSLPTG